MTVRQGDCRGTSCRQAQDLFSAQWRARLAGTRGRDRQVRDKGLGPAVQQQSWERSKEPRYLLEVRAAETD